MSAKFQRQSPTRVLYVCYLSLQDPLVETQVVAYMVGLARVGHTVHLVTFEPARLTRRARSAIKRKYNDRGITWHYARYHKRPSVLATALDVLVGTLKAWLIVRKYRLDAVHARSHVPAAMTLVLNRLFGLPFIFDIRGLMAEEYVDAGRWPPGGLAFKITKSVERRAIQRATGIVVLTEKVRSILFGEALDPRVHVIPCCADVERIARSRQQRDRLRRELGIDQSVVLIYLGKFSGWYMEREMVDFFAVARKQEPRLFFQVLTQSEPEAISKEFRRAGIDETGFSIRRVPAERVGEYLVTADAAISFIRRCPSKASSSPTKIGEYLAAGLPVITSAGIGDLDDLLDAEVGVSVSEFDESSYAGAAAQVWELASDPETAARCTSIADTRLSLQKLGIPEYDRLYADVARAVASSAE